MLPFAEIKFASVSAAVPDQDDGTSSDDDEDSRGP